MRKNFFAIFLLCFISALLSQQKAIAYGKNVHAKITEEVLKQNANIVNTYFKNIGLTNGIDEDVNGGKVGEWIKDGSKLEDEYFSSLVTLRFLNHFYDPLTGLGLTGLGVSSYVWASNDGHNAWRWEMARAYLYDGLTKTTKTDRDEALSKAFRAIGQVMHLVQDLAVPAHVRDDPHLTVEPYEHWTTINIDKLEYSMVPFQYWNVSISPYAPKQFWDLDSYDGSTVYESGYIGLSEYTNANFFSRDTIFKDYPHPSNDDTNWTNIDFMHPEKIDAEDGKIDSRIYIKKITGDTGYSLAARSYVSYDCIKKGYYQFQPWVLDDKVHKEYASRLIPRAVGYSAGLLEYFFRGNIEITLPDNGVYGLVDNTAGGSDRSFKKIHLKAQNKTSTGEEMSNGTVQLVVKYKIAESDPFQTGAVPTFGPAHADDNNPDRNKDFYYAVVSVTQPVEPEDQITSIPRDNPIELVFDLSDNPIPLWATDVYLQVVYRGQLGNESGAVAVGFKDISEPTPIAIVNDMDQVCLNSTWYVAGSPDAIAQVDTNNDGIASPSEGYDVYPHAVKNIYMKIAPREDTNPASSTDYTYHNEALQVAPNTIVTPIYVLSDQQINMSSKVSSVKLDTHDMFWEGFFLPEVFAIDAVARQDDYLPPVFWTHRDHVVWDSMAFYNDGYELCPEL